MQVIANEDFIRNLFAMTTLPAQPAKSPFSTRNQNV